MMAVAIAAVAQNVFPPRVQITVTGLTLADDVVLARVVGGVATELRAGSFTDVTDTALVAYDAELPFGVALLYRATVNGSTTFETAPASYALPGTRAVLSDAVTGLSAAVHISSWDDRERDPQASTFTVGGRHVVVSQPMSDYRTTLEVLTITAQEQADMIELLKHATQNVLQLRSDGTLPDTDAYLSILGVRESRVHQTVGTKRIWALEVVETRAWAAMFAARGFTWADVENYYSGLTWADLENDYTGQTWLDFMQADWS